MNVMCSVSQSLVVAIMNVMCSVSQNLVVAIMNVMCLVSQIAGVLLRLYFTYPTLLRIET
jgi:hypothetical protein